MSTLVSGLFPSRESAEQAVDELIKVGFSQQDISLLMSDRTRGREFHELRSTNGNGSSYHRNGNGRGTRGVLTTVAGSLDSVSSVREPGLPLVAAGPIVEALSRLNGGETRGLTGALVGLGVPEREARFLQGEIQHGGILVGVYVHDEGGTAESGWPRHMWSGEEFE
jgi:Heat induced stress protein YflT